VELRISVECIRDAALLADFSVFSGVPFLLFFFERLDLQSFGMNVVFEATCVVLLFDKLLTQLFDLLLSGLTVGDLLFPHALHFSTHFLNFQIPPLYIILDSLARLLLLL